MMYSINQVQNINGKIVGGLSSKSLVEKTLTNFLLRYNIVGPAVNYCMLY